MSNRNEKYSVADLSLKHMAFAMRELREIGRDCSSMEEAAQRTVAYFYDRFEDPQTPENELALVRFYITHDYGRLAPEQREFADENFPQLVKNASTKCLVLLATAGQREEWNSVSTSRGHRVVPLPSPEAVQGMPMIAKAINDLGYKLEQVLSPEPGFIVSEEEQSYNVFYVPDALGSPYIPAQNDFVSPYGIRSALGCGGMLPSGSLFVVILFSKASIPHSTAEIFKSLAVSIKVSIVLFDEVAVFQQGRK
jgi:hypothetical protein